MIWITPKYYSHSKRNPITYEDKQNIAECILEKLPS